MICRDTSNFQPVAKFWNGCKLDTVPAKWDIRVIALPWVTLNAPVEFGVFSSSMHVDRTHHLLLPSNVRASHAWDM